MTCNCTWPSVWSELLEIPTVVASTDLLGLMPLSMASLMEKQMGLRVLAIPLELPVVPIYTIWHETRSKRDSGAPMAA